MIWALLAVAVVAVVGFGVALAVRGRREYAEQHTVVPGRASAAPSEWAGAHSREARLHRRLGDAVKAAHANPRFVELGLAPQMAAIDAEALAIDERLVAAAALPAAHRDAALDALEANVVELEQTIADMVTGVTVADSKELLQQAVSAADIRLEALARARAEVERVDAEALGQTDALGEVQRSIPDPDPDAVTPDADPDDQPRPRPA